MGIRKDGGRLPLESRPERLLTAPVSAGSALTVPVQPLGTEIPGALGERVVTGCDGVVDVGAGWVLGAEGWVGWATAAPPLERECAGRWWGALWAWVLWAWVA